MPGIADRAQRPGDDLVLPFLIETSGIRGRLLRVGPVIDTEAGRQAHLDGPIAAALMARADDLLSQPPQIDRVDLLASKLPH